jgi:F-type H+-transporting ATPase subunit epsilon
MDNTAMRLKILLPSRVLAKIEGVTRIVVETSQGNLGLLPRRLDCTAILVPGILIYTLQPDQEAYFAVDEGVIVKSGSEVLVSVRHAMSGSDLASLRRAVEHEFLTKDEMEKSLRSSLAKLESHFVRNFLEISHGG